MADRISAVRDDLFRELIERPMRGHTSPSDSAPDRVLEAKLNPNRSSDGGFPAWLEAEWPEASRGGRSEPSVGKQCDAERLGWWRSDARSQPEHDRSAPDRDRLAPDRGIDL